MLQAQEIMDYLSSHRIAHKHIVNQRLLVIPSSNPADLAEHFTCIESVVPTNNSYPLASKEWKKETTINVGDDTINPSHFTLMAGPCSVENEKQIFETAAFLSQQGVKYIRGGAYKPRTSPYSFRGLGKKGLELLAEAAKTYNLKVVTEIIDLSVLDEMMQYADVLQVGSRNMQNFYMLNELGKINKPVLLKRGMSAKVKEWLLAAEYVLSGGNENVILCERGIRSFDPDSRNVMDVGVIPLLKELSHLPIIADPSHGTGAASRVLPLSLASAAAGADGLLIEVHPKPQEALSDKEQALSFRQFENLLAQLNLLLPAIGKKAQTESGIFKLQSL